MACTVWCIRFSFFGLLLLLEIYSFHPLKERCFFFGFIKPQIPPSSEYTWHSPACRLRVWCSSSFSASPCSEMPFSFFFHLLRTTCLLASLCTATSWGERTEKKRCLDAFSSPGMDTVIVLASWVWARILEQPGAFSRAGCPLSPEAYYLQRLQLLAPG